MRKQKAKDIEGAFLKPAFTYLVKNGLENTSVRELCKEMDVSYGSINYWFEGKDDIYISVVKYGTEKVVSSLIEKSAEAMKNPKDFFDNYLNELDNVIMELRLIFQVTSSPVYGERMREKSKELFPLYGKFIDELTKVFKCEADVVAPVVYLLLAITSDYVVWEDRPVAEIQLQYLYTILSEKLK